MSSHASEMKDMRKLWVRIRDFAFEAIVEAWPADTRDWARAMQAEATEITDARESFSWLLGGVMSLTKAWWKRILFGAKDPATIPAPRMPGSGAVALLLIAAASFLLPAMRQGVTAVFGSWTKSHGEIPVAELQRLGRVAEVNKDAKALAFAAMTLPVSDESVRWADSAVSLDPKLTWVYFQMPLYCPDCRASDAEFDRLAARLQQWDPENSVPYVMQANRIFERSEWRRGYFNVGAFDVNPKSAAEISRDAAAFAADHPDWAALMSKAFHGSHYDDYANRRFALTLDVMRQQNLNRPEQLISTVFGSQFLSPVSTNLYAASLIHDGDARAERHDPAAANDYWLIANFARLLLQGRTESFYALSTGSNLLHISAQRLHALFEREGRSDEARLAGYLDDDATNMAKAMKARYVESLWGQWHVSWSGFLVNLALFLAIPIAAVTVLAFSWLALTWRSNSRTLGRRSLCAFARFSPAVVSFLIVFFYANYLPYAMAMRKVRAENLLSFARSYYSILGTPLVVGNIPLFQTIFFWTAFMVVACSVLAVLVARIALRGDLENRAA